MGQGLSNRIRGNCLNFDPNQKRAKALYRTVTAHAVLSSSPCGQPRISMITGCNGNSFYPNDPYKQFIPPQYITSNSVVNGLPYGSEQQTVNLTDTKNNPIFFFPNDVTSIVSRNLCPPPYNRTFAAGPAVSNAHLFASLPRKFAPNNNYLNRENYEFVDSNITIPTDKSKICGKGCETNNWLINIGGRDATTKNGGADFIYSNLNEPFKINTHFEDSGQRPPQSCVYGCSNLFPFCTPFNARIEDPENPGNYILRGQYYGYTTSMIFSPAVHVFPQKPYLVEDPYNNNPQNKPLINPKNVMYSIEVSVFLAGSNADLGSPLLTRIRYWFIQSVFQIKNYYEPFQILFKQPGFNYDYYIDLNANIVNPDKTITPITIPINFSNLQVLVTF